MADIILESVRALVVGLIFLFLWRAGKKRRDLARQGWSLVVIGFGLMTFGCTLDITDNFQSLNHFIIIGDTEAEAFLEKLIGHLGGMLFLAMGLIVWIPTVTGIDRIERLNTELEVHRNRLKTENKELTHALRTDRLTRVMSRAAWEAAADTECDRCHRTGESFGLIILDIDHFKPHNDTAGHLAGDKCLVRVATCIKNTCRGMDSVGRFGGEEFVVLAPHTNREDAIALAERIRAGVAALKIPHPGLDRGTVVTVSAGVAVESPESWEDTFCFADQAMYEAKSAGRNAVCAWPDDIAAA